MLKFPVMQRLCDGKTISDSGIRYNTCELWQIFQNNIIIILLQVVYGYADYKYILPKDSFINVLDFVSPKSLAKYLKTVSKDKQKYNSHMIWRKNYCSERTHYKYLCKLCEKLNENVDNRAKVTNGTKTILDQWNRTEKCYTPGNFSVWKSNTKKFITF